MFFLLLLILPGMRAQDFPSFDQQYGLGNPKSHPFNSVQFIKPQPTKKGPILFPNDAPPPPPRPLVVTLRPLAESIAQSDRNPNNSLTAQSQLNQVSYRPEYLARNRNYSPYSYNIATVAPLYEYRSTLSPYTDVEKKVQEYRKNTHYTQFAKLLMGAIHQRKPTVKQETFLWDQPIYRRQMNQDQSVFEKRRSFFYDNDNKSKRNTLWHSSLYSREKNEINQEKPSDSNVHGGSNGEEWIEQRKGDEERADRRNRRLFGKRDIQSGNKDSPILRRPSQNLQNLSDNYRIETTNAPREYEIEATKSSENYRIKTTQPREYSEEVIQERSLRPLYALTDHNHVSEQTIYQKPITQFNYQVQPEPVTGLKYQEQPKPQYQSKSPSYSNYFSSEDLHDNTEERHGKDYDKGENYAFSYAVKDHKTGDDFSHSQQSTGTATNGEYRVRLPDGRMQIVSYTADENGYKADVRYDEKQDQDNSIDIDSREHRYDNTNSPNSYKNKNSHEHFYNDHLDSRDFSSNKDYLDHRFNSEFDDDHHKQPELHSHHSDMDHNHDDITHHTDDDHSGHVLSNDNDDYLDNFKDKKYVESDDKLDKNQDSGYFLNEDIPLSKELIDYSSEVSAYQPHKSKFSSFIPHKKEKSGVTPSYDDLKEIFVTNIYRRLQNDGSLLGSTLRPNYEATTENVVVIGTKKPNFYTNIQNNLPFTPSSLFNTTPQPSFASTPSGYLLSTIANLKSQINLGNKPVLSSKYIDKINKYLSYK